MKILKILSIAIVKYIPIILAIYTLITIISSFWIKGLIIADILWKTFYTLQLIGFLILSKTFKFCIYHQLIIYYLMFVFLIFEINYLIGIPIFIGILSKILLIISGITIIAVILTYLKYGNRKISQKDKLTD